MQQYGKFTITSKDPQDWRSYFGTTKYQKPCLAYNDKPNFTTICCAEIVSFLLIFKGSWDCVIQNTQSEESAMV